MPKNKKKKKALQGMEHLSEQIDFQNSNDQSINDNDSMSETHLNLKHDLLVVFTIISVLVLIVLALMYLDKTTNYLNIIAEKFMSFI
ncbi:MAG: hypothetical protein WCV50_05285 [Patescibacteria group bacterium]|jgi:hypothetical protein